MITYKVPLEDSTGCTLVIARLIADKKFVTADGTTKSITHIEPTSLGSMGLPCAFSTGFGDL